MVDQDEPILSDSPALREAQGSPSLPQSADAKAEPTHEISLRLPKDDTLETTPNETATQSKPTTDD